MSRAQETRRRLLDQGRIAFAAKGHDGVSLQRDVLEPAGISTGSFYHQFDDKTALLVAILEEASELIRYVFATVPAANPDESPVDAMRRPFELFFDTLDGADDLFCIAIREVQSSNKRVRQLLRDFRDRWVELMTPRLSARFADEPPFDVDTVALVVNAMCFGIAVQYLDLPEARRPEARSRYIDTMSVFVTGGVGALGTE